MRSQTVNYDDPAPASWSECEILISIGIKLLSDYTIIVIKFESSAPEQREDNFEIEWFYGWRQPLRNTT